MAHFAGYLTAVFLVLSPVRAAVFNIVQQGLYGLYLGCSFAPNPKSMPILDTAGRSQAPIESFCQQHGVPYCQTTLVGSYARAIRHLHAAGRPGRPAAAA